MGSCFSAESRSPIPNSPTPSLGIKKKKNSKKRPPGLRSASFDHRREEQLHRVAGRMFLNGSSEVASLFTQQGKKGTNQDAMIVWENFGSRTDTVFCGVFDGHGPLGHMVAKRVRDSLPLKLCAHWEVNLKDSNDVLKEIMGSFNSEGTSINSPREDSRVSINFEETDKNPEIFQTLKESFLKAYKVMDKELSMYANVDCFCSGTTAVTLIKQVRWLKRCKFWVYTGLDKLSAASFDDVDEEVIHVFCTYEIPRTSLYPTFLSWTKNCNFCPIHISHSLMHAKCNIACYVMSCHV